MWALTGWSRGKAAPERFHEIVAMLVAAGSEVDSGWLEWDRVRADPGMRAALLADVAGRAGDAPRPRNRR
jgi:hypothetical protein